MDQRPPLPAPLPADIERLRRAIADGTHWIFATDDPFAASVLRRSASGALVLETVVNTDTGESFPLVVVAVSKKAWPVSAAVRVAAAALGGRGARPDTKKARSGGDIFPLSESPERLALVLQQIRDGKMALEPPPG